MNPYDYSGLGNIKGLFQHQLDLMNQAIMNKRQSLFQMPGAEFMDQPLNKINNPLDTDSMNSDQNSFINSKQIASSISDEEKKKQAQAQLQAIAAAKDLQMRTAATKSAPLIDNQLSRPNIPIGGFNF